MNEVQSKYKSYNWSTRSLTRSSGMMWCDHNNYHSRVCEIESITGSSSCIFEEQAYRINWSLDCVLSMHMRSLPWSLLFWWWWLSQEGDGSVTFRIKSILSKLRLLYQNGSVGVLGSMSHLALLVWSFYHMWRICQTALMSKAFMQTFIVGVKDQVSES